MHARPDLRPDLPAEYLVAAERDLMARTRLGAPTYLIVLGLLGTVTPYRAEHARIYWSVSAAILISLGLRFVIITLRRTRWPSREHWSRAALQGAIAISATLLGFLYATTAQFYGFESWTFSITALWTMGIATGSTISYTPDMPFMTAAVALLLLPPISYGVFLHSAQGAAFALSVTIWLLFLLFQGRHTNRLYWNLARERAAEAQHNRDLMAAKAAAEKAQDELRFQATHDALTAVLNRGELLRQLRKEMNRGYRTRESLGVLMLDIDHFKRVNDQHGHLAGDEVLRTVARRIRESTRSYDLVGRYGGEEFLVVMPRCGMPQALHVANRILGTISAEPVRTGETSLPITVSGGVSVTIPQWETAEDEVLAPADAAMYEAKRCGRNRIVAAEQMTTPP